MYGFGSSTSGLPKKQPMIYTKKGGSYRWWRARFYERELWPGAVDSYYRDNAYITQLWFEDAKGNPWSSHILYQTPEFLQYHGGQDQAYTIVYDRPFAFVAANLTGRYIARSFVYEYSPDGKRWYIAAKVHGEWWGGNYPTTLTTVHTDFW